VPGQWERLGLIFTPDRRRWWQRSHAYFPAVLALGGARHRVYYASRDEHSRAHVGWFDLDLERPAVVDACEEPVLAPGPRGHFDGDGVLASSVVRDGDRVRLYTVGWTVGAPPPVFYTSIGLALSADGGRTLARYGRAPVMERSEHDPWMVSGPHVLAEDGRWRMWYMSGTGWDGPRSAYDIKYAESADGITWRRDGHVCLGGARNVARACVLRDGGGYRAWYSADAGAGYRILYAESADGLAWERHDGWGLEPAGRGWESEAVSYPAVVRYGDRLFMLYNGNRFGRDGLGLATRISS
jgi:predicted GH43/DUF377 family glycosyl hydrolase